jgi:DNA polymerase
LFFDLDLEINYQKVLPGLEDYGLSREMVYVTNVVKCWPRKTRNPKKIHINKCGYHHQKEIKGVKPFVILAFGNTCNIFYRGEESGIMKLSGTTTCSDEYNCWICWCVHPASVLYSPENKKYYRDGILNFIDKVSLLVFA